ncbi:MAG: class I SAM-dependent methyltransferase [Asgard group archaeon]|nr:class I SAM-dependent methyltransferase [Asgard group archaeon]
MKSDAAKDYDEMDEVYIRKSENFVYNAHYERPAIISLLGEVKGKKVLDAGCGGGVLTEWLVENGGDVIAFDISEKMVEHAKKRLKEKAVILQADLSQSLDFVDDYSIDVIVSSLVLHYIDNWLPVFSEFDRILKSNGFVVFSVHHPHADWLWFNKENYFKKELYNDTWTIEGKPYHVSYYHRTLASMFAIFKKFNFYVDVLLEPLPTKEAKEIDPEAYEKLAKNPRFLFFKLKKLPVK